MIRAANIDDKQAVYLLMLQLSQHKFTQEQFDACYEYTIKNHFIIVSQQNDHINGFGIINIHYPLHFSQKVAEIVDLIVDDGSRGQGIGKELLKTMEQIAKQNNCVRIELDSSKWREDAHRFYERENFIKTHYKLTKSINNASL